MASNASLVNITVLILISLSVAISAFKIGPVNNDHDGYRKYLLQKHKKSFDEFHMNELNMCIFGCSQCAKISEQNNDLADHVIVSCANTCLSTTDYQEVLHHLVEKKITNKLFAQCFIDQMTNDNFEFNLDK